MHIPTQWEFFQPYLDSVGSHLATCSHLPLTSREIPQYYTNKTWGLTNNNFLSQCPPVTLGWFFSGRHSCFESLAFKQGKTINYQAPLQACLKNKTMRSKWPNSHSPDIPYRKLKHHVLQNTKVGHGGSSKNQHCEFLSGIHRPQESVLSCQSLRFTSDINTRGVQCPLCEPLTPFTGFAEVKNHAQSWAGLKLPELKASEWKLEILQRWLWPLSFLNIKSAILLIVFPTIVSPWLLSS